MIGGIRYQDRDKAILSDLAEYGVLDTETIRQRHFPDATTPQACAKKLRQYKELGLVQAIDVTLDGKKSSVYWLTALGHEELVGLGGPAVPPLTNVSSKTIHHRLGVAKTRITFDDGFRSAKLTKPAWLVEPDPKLRYSSHVAGQAMADCNPDASCCANLPGGWQLVAYLEFDRSTETNNRVAEKLPGYANLLTSSAYRTKHWPNIGDRHVVRVLFVCPSPQRIENLRQTFLQSPVRQHLRFAVASDILGNGGLPEPSPNLLVRPIWGDHLGKRMAILKSLPE
jgi:hypothetical protein